MRHESDRYKLLGSVRLYNVLIFLVLVIFILPFQSFTAIIFVIFYFCMYCIDFFAVLFLKIFAYFDEFIKFEQHWGLISPICIILQCDNGLRKFYYKLMK